MDSRTFYRFLTTAAWGLPALVMLTAYVAIVVYTGNLWPWFEFVHESGDRTLLDTVFYFQHAARELPLDLVLGLAIGGSALWAFPKTGYARRNRQALLAGGLMIVIGIIVAGTLKTGGVVLLWDNLLQMYTRPGEEQQFGSHWHYHFISRLMLMLVSFGLAGLVVLKLRGRQGAGGKTGQSVFIGTLVVYFIISVIFGLSFEPFLDPVFLGHQVREAFTHVLVSVPLAWWVCLLLLGDDGQVSEQRTVSVVLPLVVGSVGVLLGLYLLIGALSASAATMGQTDSLSLLIWPHFFEHSFSYLLVPLAAGLTYDLLHA